MEKNEETRQFEKIYEEVNDSIIQEKKKLKKEREEIKKDEYFVL